jgi:hypothetical protein
MATKGKVSIVYQEKYKKGNIINKDEMKRLINDNIDAIKMEMRERTKYSDGTEGITIEVRY